MKFLYLFILLLLSFTLFGQTQRKLNTPTDTLYQNNIKKSRLYGTYIPRDIEDALNQLMKLTTDEARAKLKLTDEETVARKLHFGLGRWMEYNWNFVEGSRFSHFLREQGLYHHDDMVKFMLVIFHRKVNGNLLNTEQLMTELIEARKIKVKMHQEKLELISVEPKINKQN